MNACPVIEYEAPEALLQTASNQFRLSGSSRTIRKAVSPDLRALVRAMCANTKNHRV